ncbi:hypothetical protein GmRootA79_28890 [Acidovorax sp. A79]|uniref:cupin domain-containing protein n=1 Tax=Acidovorax sp. A79 TaxID=3056107 RepID=UPI0034E86196
MPSHRLIPLLAALLGTMALPVLAAGGGDGGAFTLTPEQITWQEGKATQRVDVHADAAHHVVTRRVRIAAGTDLPPHGHERGYRLVTVVSGTLLLGFGDRFDAAMLKPMPPGSVFSEDAGHRHFARTLQEPVVLQLTEVCLACAAPSPARP